MPSYSYTALTIELDDDGGSPQDISQYVTQINGWNVERLLEDVTGAGDDTDRWTALGFQQKNPVMLTGPYNDAADGLVDIVNQWTDDTERTLTLTFDSPTAADVVNVECLLNRVQRNPARGRLTEFIVTLRPTGPIT